MTATPTFAYFYCLAKLETFTANLFATAEFCKIVAQHHFVLVADRLLRMGQMMLPWLYGLVETWL